jgi:hypothetical protein
LRYSARSWLSGENKILVEGRILKLPDVFVACTGFGMIFIYAFLLSGMISWVLL